MNHEDPTVVHPQEALDSLQQLEPSPVESPLETQEKSFPTTAASPAPTPSSFRPVTRLQRYSSYIFTLFTTIHLTNTSLIPLLTHSLPASEPYLLLTRPYYQTTLLEPLLVTLPLLTHISAGVLLRLHRRNTTLSRYGGADLSASHRWTQRTRVWPSLSWVSLTGYILAPLVLGHVAANRMLPLYYEGGSSGVGLGFVAHGFAKHPWLAWGGYGVLVAVGSGHVVWGWARWMGWMPRGQGKGKVSDRRRRWVVNGVAMVLAVVWMAGGLGVVGRGGRGEGWIGKGWDDLYAKVPLLGL